MFVCLAGWTVLLQSVLFACLTNVEHPEVSQSAATHPSVDDEPVGSAAGRHHSGVTLSGGRRLTRGQWNLPADHTGARPQLQTIQVVQIPDEEREQRHHTQPVSDGFIQTTGTF